MTTKNILIKNGTIVTNGVSCKTDILVENETITHIGNSLPVTNVTKTVDASGCLVTYGLADVHVHLREPGFSEKETIATGSRAAAHGGFTTVCAMPNLEPAPDRIKSLNVERNLITQNAIIDVRPYATITKERRGEEIVDVKALQPYVAAFSDDGSGIQTEETMREAMLKVKAVDGLIAAHCEDNTLLHGGYINDGRYAHEHGHRGICSESEWVQIARDVKLAEETGCRYHVCHISTKESVAIIREGQKRGIQVTCETAPHYLALTEDDLQEDGRFKMNPPLRTQEDRAALIEGIKDGTIAVIATDHAPHTIAQKSKGLKGSAMGVTGLETAFPIVYTTLVHTGLISIEKMIELMCDNPRRIFHLGGALKEGEKADLAVFDLTTPYRIDSTTFLSKGHSTPFDGKQVYGRCLLTLFRGKAVWQEEK